MALVAPRALPPGQSRYARCWAIPRRNCWLKVFQNITHPESEADLEVRQLLAGTGESYQMEKRYFTKRGHLVLLSVSGACGR
jgi:hypothetical protein